MMTVEDNELLVRVGPGTAMGNLFRRFWLPVMLVSEVEEPDGPPVRLRILGEDLVAFRASDGRVGVLRRRRRTRRRDGSPKAIRGPRPRPTRRQTSA